MTEHSHKDPNGDVPIWVRVLYRYGVPATLALFLVWFVTMNLSSAIAGVAQNVVGLQQDHQMQTFYLKAICLNVARDEAGRALCTPSGK